MSNLRRVLLALLLPSLAAFAQTAQITGRITDTTGAVIPGTSITVTNVATAADRNVRSNQDGYYTVPLLLPGEYRIRVDQQGFRPITRSGIALAVDQRAEINFTLEVGAIAERIE